MAEKEWKPGDAEYDFDNHVYDEITEFENSNVTVQYENDDDLGFKLAREKQAGEP